jgi:hypothetical protein
MPKIPRNPKYQIPVSGCPGSFQVPIMMAKHAMSMASGIPLQQAFALALIVM